MKLPVSTTTAAVVLTALAITVPCAAWFVAGSRSVQTEADQLIGLTSLKAAQTASSLAEGIAGRLGVILDVESRRPVYQYQHAYHDPNSTCECASITPSPLALGPQDGLIESHFQISPMGKLSIPTLGTPAPGEEKKEEDWLRRQRELRTRLQGALPEIRAAVSEAREKRAAGHSDNREMASQVVAAWDGTKVVMVEVEVPCLEWYVIPIDGDSTLVALRDLNSSSRIVIQGFVISVDAVTRSLEGAFLPARFLPSLEGDAPVDGDVTARVPLDGVDWVVRVDAGDVIARASLDGDAIIDQFRTTFALSSAAALIAGLFVIALVWQTERLSRERSQFAAAAAHELRTPLAGLQLYSEMLSEGLGDRERSRTYASHIAAEAQRLGRVVSNVLSFSQLERRAVTVHLEPGDLGAAMADCIERLRPPLESRGLEIDFTEGKKFPGIRFDRDALFHIMQNLLDNAEKYTRGLDNRTVNIELQADGDGVDLKVIDHGDGIPDSVKSTLFRSFSHSNRHESLPGLGLGLLIVREFAEAQGGAVSCSDTPGGGAVFTVTFRS